MNIDIIYKAKKSIEDEYEEKVKQYDKQSKWFSVDDIAYFVNKTEPIPVKITGIVNKNGYYSYYFRKDGLNFFDIIIEKIKGNLFKDSFFIGRDEGLYLTKDEADNAYFYSLYLDVMNKYIKHIGE